MAGRAAPPAHASARSSTLRTTCPASQCSSTKARARREWREWSASTGSPARRAFSRLRKRKHARLLTQEHAFAVDGLDVELAFVRISRAKLPGAWTPIAS